MVEKDDEMTVGGIQITGFGAMSALGVTRRNQHEDEINWTFPNPRAARSLASGSTGHRSLGIPSDFSIRDYVKSIGIRRKQRFSQIAVAAAVDAYDDAAFSSRPTDLNRVGVVATTEYGPQRVVADYLDGLLGGGLLEASPGLFTQTVYNVANGQASLALGLRGANSTLVGGSAVVYAALLIESGKADAIFALGLEETNAINSEYFDSVLGEGVSTAFPFRTGEAAAVVVLESGASAETRGAIPRAEILGFATLSAPGAGMTYLDWPAGDDTIEHAMRGALLDADKTISEIDLVVATSNGLDGITRSEFAAFDALGWDGPVAYPRLAAGECFGGNESMAYVLGLPRLAPGGTALITVATVNGGVTSTVVRKVGS